MKRLLAVSLCGALITACDAAEVDDPLVEESEALVSAGDWSHQDIGAVGAVGGDSVSSTGAHTVTGAGANIGGTADAFHFVYKRMVGDTTIVARVKSLQKTSPFAQAAVLIREDLYYGSKYVGAVVTPTSTNRFLQQRRTTSRGNTVVAKTSSNSYIPVWLRVVRKGSTFSTAYSSDGRSWKSLGNPVTVAMEKPVYVGFGVSSHVAGKLAAATFDNVGVSGVAACEESTLRCSALDLQICAGGVWWHNGCHRTCGSIACGSCIPNTAPFYCIVDPYFQPPSTQQVCPMYDSGARPCPEDPTGTPCDSATQTYLYVYQRTGEDALSLITDRYYVCDNNSWGLGS